MHLLGAKSEKRAQGWRGTSIRVSVPGSRATASCLQPLHPSSSGPPGAAQLLPKADGRAPLREVGHAEGHPGLFLQRLREGGCPTWGEGQGRSPKHGEDEVPVPPPTRPPPAWGPQAAPAPLRRGPRAAHLSAARGAHAPAPQLCSSSGQSSPRSPARRLDPRAPGAARLTFPARPTPPRSLLRAAPSEARFRLFSHSRRQPLLPSCVRPSPPRPANSVRAPARPSRRRAPSARAHRAAPGLSGAHRVSACPDRMERRAIDPVARQPGL